MKNFKMLELSAVVANINTVKTNLKSGADLAAKTAPQTLIFASEQGDYNIKPMNDLYLALGAVNARRETILQAQFKKYCIKYFAGIEFNEKSGKFIFKEKGAKALDKRFIRDAFTMSQDFRAMPKPVKADAQPTVVKASRIEKLKESIVSYMATLETEKQTEYTDSITDALLELVLTSVPADVLAARLAVAQSNPEHGTSRGESDQTAVEIAAEQTELAEAV